MVVGADIRSSDKKRVIENLISQSRVDDDFYLLLMVSTLITTLGLIEGSAAVVIGGMLIAPLLWPILELGLGIITRNKKSLRRSLVAIIKSTGVVIGVSMFTSFLLGVREPNNPEILARLNPSLSYFYIAVLSGIGAAFAWAKPKISASIPGIAVSVALLPPLAVCGIGLSFLDRTMATQSFHLFFISLIGVMASSALIFSLLGFHSLKSVENVEIRKEERKLSKKEV